MKPRIRIPWAKGPNPATVEADARYRARQAHPSARSTEHGRLTLTVGEVVEALNRPRPACTCGLEGNTPTQHGYFCALRAWHVTNVTPIES